ncbi:MAG: SDR family NAD(P)-dependent oxidoreductase [Sphingomonadaceae bacterium]|jgi:NAD(P)-dependent dehydrogenase (short-subunit alcohol dehydrogenase family)
MKTLDQFNIAGRSALVTGAASGIGLAYAEAMAEAGASVTLADLDMAGAEREAERLRGEGADARAAHVDISQLDQVARAFDDHLAAFGGLDICFANAGWDAGDGFWSPEGARNPDGRIDRYDPDKWRRSIDINLSGAYYTIREAVRCMRDGGRKGAIIATASNAGIINEAIVGIPYMPAKAGVLHLVRHAALELAEFGIRVNAIAPGPFVTNIGDGWVKKNPDAKTAFDKTIPLGAMAETDQIKPLALFLASDASSYVTGAHVVIDGGVQLGNFK